LVLHHYVIKSREEFAAKNARGSGAGNVKVCLPQSVVLPRSTQPGTPKPPTCHCHHELTVPAVCCMPYAATLPCTLSPQSGSHSKQPLLLSLLQSWAFFDYMDGLANASCPWGMDVGAAFMASQPPLRPPRGGSLRAALCGGSGDGEAASVVTNSSRISSGGGGGAMGPHASSAAAATLDRNQPALVAAYEEESG
jgi:hypothetical protein